jgi:hypothetical protein
MRRRDFLKGIFGAAAIAAVPAIVLRQIDELPPSEKVDATGNIYTGPINPEDNILYIYDENQLVGESHIFNLNFHQAFNPIPKSKWVKLPWDGRYYKNKKNKKGLPKKKHRWQLVEDYNAPAEYFQGLKLWEVRAYQIQWLTEPRELFERLPTQLHCLMVKDSMKFCGNVYLTQLDSTSPLDEETTYGAIFEGSGELIMIIQKG